MNLATQILILISLVGSLPIERQVVPVINAQVVRLISDRSICSGFIIADSYIATAKHCIGPNSNGHFEAIFSDGISESFQAVASGGPTQDDDYAILKGDTRRITPVRVAKYSPSNWSHCTFIGFGGGSQMALKSLCEVLGLPEATGLIPLLATAIRGDSGSEVFDDNNEVFGILVRSAFPETSIAKAVDIQRVKLALEKLGVN